MLHVPVLAGAVHEAPVPPGACSSLLCLPHGQLWPAAQLPEDLSHREVQPPM